MLHKQTNYTLLVLLLSALLSACMGGSPTPQDHYYRLGTGKQTSPATYQLPYKVIGIPPAFADGLYRERSILHVDSATPLELQQYHYYHWHDAPANLVQEHLIARLQQVVPDTRFVNLERGDNAAVILQTRILRFEREHTKQGAVVLVRLEMKLQKKHQVIYKKQLQQSVSLNNNSMYATVEAFGNALDQIYDQFLQDVTR